MPQIVNAVDASGRRFKVTEEQARKRGLTVVETTQAPEAKNKKRTTTSKKKA